MNDDHLARLALALLPGITPARADRLLTGSEPGAVVDAVASGRVRRLPGFDRARFDDELLSQWRSRVGDGSLDRALATHRRLGIGILSPRDPEWPLADDPHPPFVLFHRGDLDLLAPRARVAVVGTRRCTGVGRSVATRLGAGLAAHDVVVLSGLALGIDAAAHRGAFEYRGAVVAVVGTGLDVVYPRANHQLWERVATAGLLLSEFAVGSRPERWRFPARNRLLAGLSQATVVVESHQRGGALSTAEEAADRGRLVMAVPGSVLSPASEGTNALLVDGAIPVRSTADVVAAIGVPSVDLADPGWEPGRSRSAPDPLAPDSLASQVLAEAATGPVHLDRLVLLTGASIQEVQAATQQLALEGRVTVHGATVTAVETP